MAGNTCQWEPRFVNSRFRCHRIVDSDYPYLCILHLADTNKPRDSFYLALNEKIAQDEADHQLPEINLAGVAFPFGTGVPRLAYQKGFTFAEAIFLAPQIDSSQAWRSNATDFHFLSFSTPVSFEHARFDLHIDFMSTQFYAGANFDDTQFRMDAVFGFASFLNESRILKPATFGRKVSFQRARFEGRTTFMGCQFNEADFSGTRFSEDVDFRGVQFYSRSIFKDANFDKIALFGTNLVAIRNGRSRGAWFGGDADFSGTRFHGEAIFSDDVSHEGVHRVTATIYELLFNFRWAWQDYILGPFEGNADFRNAKFDKGARFDGAHFAKNADFSNATFSDLADFRWTKFGNAVMFINTNFGAREINFAGARFSGVTVFRGAKFPERAYYDENYVSSLVFDLSPFAKAWFIDQPDFGDCHLWRGYIRKS